MRPLQFVNYLKIHFLQKESGQRYCTCMNNSVPKRHRFLNGNLSTRHKTSLWVIGQGSPRGIQSNIGCCHGSWGFIITSSKTLVPKTLLTLILGPREIHLELPRACFLLERCSAGCWERKDLSILLQCWTLNAILLTFQAICVYWGHSGKTVSWVTNAPLIGFKGYPTRGTSYLAL